MPGDKEADTLTLAGRPRFGGLVAMRVFALGLGPVGIMIIADRDVLLVSRQTPVGIMAVMAASLCLVLGAVLLLGTYQTSLSRSDSIILSDGLITLRSPIDTMVRPIDLISRVSRVASNGRWPAKYRSFVIEFSVGRDRVISGWFAENIDVVRAQLVANLSLAEASSTSNNSVETGSGFRPSRQRAISSFIAGATSFAYGLWLIVGRTGSGSPTLAIRGVASIFLGWLLVAIGGLTVVSIAKQSRPSTAVVRLSGDLVMVNRLLDSTWFSRQAVNSVGEINRRWIFGPRGFDVKVAGLDRPLRIVASEAGQELPSLHAALSETIQP